MCWFPAHAGTPGLVASQALRVDGEALPFCEHGCKACGQTPCSSSGFAGFVSREAVVDSGTSLLAVPTPIFPEMYEMLRQGLCK